MTTATRTARIAASTAGLPMGVRVYRALHPRARRTAPTAIELSTSCRRVYGCVCGAKHSEAASVQVRPGLRIHCEPTKATAEWHREHAACADHLVAAHPEIVAAIEAAERSMGA